MVTHLYYLLIHVLNLLLHSFLLLGELQAQKITGDARATIARQVNAIHYSADFEYIFGATSSGDYIICSVKATRIQQSISATKMALHSIIVHNGKVYIGCGDKTIKIYSINGDFVGQIALDGAVIGLSLSADQLEVRHV